ncbi:hypothetical protein [Pseudarthrobacter sp. NPDC057230]|uniref:hypothetical protein n=1 Tax=Pseudarthrobacter sp. NPDC057230 TaxID=3346057 RepID=UPI00362C50E3
MIERDIWLSAPSMGEFGFQVFHDPRENNEFAPREYLDFVEACLEVEGIGVPAITPVPQPKPFNTDDVQFYETSRCIPRIFHHCYPIAVGGGPRIDQPTY